MFRSVLDSPEKQCAITVLVNGVPTAAWKGETVASVVMRVPDAGRRSPISGQLRLPYCQMGVCFECLVVVDGVPSTQGCLVPVVAGMRIESQRGPRGVAR